MQVVVIAQVNGTRYVALTDEDAESVRGDPAMADGISPEACLDVGREGRREWSCPFGCADSAEGRAAVRRYLSQ